jgi:cyclase
MEYQTRCLERAVTVFRFFSRLDVKNSHVVKGIQLEGLRKVGEPKDLAQKYLKNGADELVLIDIVASLYNRPNVYSLITEIAEELRIPLTVLGGVRNLSDAKDVFNSGADKVAINSSAIKSPELLTSIANLYGSQSVVCSVEAKRRNRADLWNCMTESGRNDSGVEIGEWVSQLEALGVGEVFVTSVDTDGTNYGPDLELCAKIRSLTDIPIIYSGGIRNSEDVYEIAQLGIDGVAVASALHYDRMQIQNVKKYLALKNISVRTQGNP